MSLYNKRSCKASPGNVSTLLLYPELMILNASLKKIRTLRNAFPGRFSRVTDNKINVPPYVLYVDHGCANKYRGKLPN